MNIDNDKELWRHQPPIGRDGRYISDFYDEYAHKQLWPDTFAKAYNQEIDDNMTTENDAINPKHYKDVAYGYQYMELMVPMLARFDGVEAHLMGQVYKYLMRSKLKDPFVQDLTKAKWYLDKLIEVAQCPKS